MKKVASHALGCKVNQYESQAIAQLFQEEGYEVVGVEEVADIYVINTCTVTNFGDKKSRQLIRKVKRQNEGAIIAVVGCYAQTAPEEIMEIDGVNLLIGTKDKSKIVSLVEEYRLENGVENHVVDIMKEKEFEPLSIEKLSNRTRAYLKIQDGCNQYCSYCIIPFARGPIRSREPEDILNEVKRLAENGFLEIVLTGIHVASYGKDRKDTSLLEILKQVHEVEGIERIRFSSIEPNVVTEEFVETIANLPKVCHHFHLSLQSGCDRTLKEMNRHYTTAQYKEAVLRLRKHLPNVGITTDIIVGFPDEREADFLETLAFVEEIQFSKIHVFPYSNKKGTKASLRTDQIPHDIKTKRASQLTKIADEMAEKFIKGQIGKAVSVLFEREVSAGIFEGHSSNYMRVQIKSEENLKNEIVSCILERNEKEIAFVKKMS